MGLKAPHFWSYTKRLSYGAEGARNFWERLTNRHISAYMSIRLYVHFPAPAGNCRLYVRTYKRKTTVCRYEATEPQALPHTHFWRRWRDPESGKSFLDWRVWLTSCVPTHIPVLLLETKASLWWFTVPYNDSHVCSNPAAGITSPFTHTRNFWCESSISILTQCTLASGLICQGRIGDPRT